MRRINLLVFTVCLMILGSTGYAQVSPDGILEREEKVDYKFFDRSYDQENNQLRRVNDTLNFYVNEQKKISFTALNIIKLKDFKGFEKDVDGFFEMLNELKLDYQNKGYSIRYRPENKEITVSERGDMRFKSVEGILIPVARHEVVFTYYGKMLEIRFFLGEMDELLVLKDAGVTELIAEQAQEFGWYENYEDNIFNKDIKLGLDGSPQVITYRNIERSRMLEIEYSIGVNFLGNLFPINQEISMNFWVKKYNKWTQEKNGFFISTETYTFLSRSEEGRFLENSNLFLNGGVQIGTTSTPVRLYFGKLLSSSNNGYFENNRTKMGMSVSVNPLLSLKSELFFGRNDEPALILLGVNLNVF